MREKELSDLVRSQKELIYTLREEIDVLKQLRRSDKKTKRCQAQELQDLEEAGYELSALVEEQECYIEELEGRLARMRCSFSVN